MSDTPGRQAGAPVKWLCRDCGRWVQGYRCPTCTAGRVPSEGKENMGRHCEPDEWGLALVAREHDPEGPP